VRTDALDFDLPADRIATTAAEPRDAARLMLCDRRTGKASHHRVADLPDLAAATGGFPGPGDLMLVNRSKVVPARFFAQRRDTGGKAEGLFLAEESAAGDAGPRWRCVFETRGKPQPGERLDLCRDTGDTVGIALALIESVGGGEWRCEVEGTLEGELTADGTPPSTWAILDAVGSTPLPPYIRKARRAAGLDESVAGDAQRYNTVYAATPGSVAAPTAGLHFTPDLLARLDAVGVRREAVTLHVRVGTFAPVRSERLEDHAMHAEWIEVPPAVVRAIAETRRAGRRVWAVGTTTVRAIESLPPASVEAGEGWTGATELFITPDNGFVFRHTDALMTNFHLPRSTLLAMVAALPGVGLAQLLDWYLQAIDAGYRFYSYGDAMLIV